MMRVFLSFNSEDSASQPTLSGEWTSASSSAVYSDWLGRLAEAAHRETLGRDDMSHLHKLRATSWALLGVIALPVLLAFGMAALKAFRVARAGYALGNETLEVLIFGGSALVVLACVSVLPAIVAVGWLICVPPTIDTWVPNVLSVPA